MKIDETPVKRLEKESTQLDAESMVKLLRQKPVSKEVARSSDQELWIKNIFNFKDAWTQYNPPADLTSEGQFSEIHGNEIPIHSLFLSDLSDQVVQKERGNFIISDFLNLHTLIIKLIN